jgi:hypothetical protein
MAAIGLSQESRRVGDRGEHAHQLIDQFIARQTDDPERSWESLVELQALMEQLRSICPPRTFRRNALTPTAVGPKCAKVERRPK